MMAAKNPLAGGENMVQPASHRRTQFRALPGLAAGVLCAAFAASPLPTAAHLLLPIIPGK